jgi:hypothetical protein
MNGESIQEITKNGIKKAIKLCSNFATMRMEKKMRITWV